MTKQRTLDRDALRQTGAILAGTIISGFAYLFALLLSGRPVTTWDVAAAAVAAAVTGWTGLHCTWRMARAANAALADTRRRTGSPTATRQLPAAVSPEVAQAQARVNAAHSAGRHTPRTER